MVLIDVNILEVMGNANEFSYSLAVSCTYSVSYFLELAEV
jgi:hypothetical protein